MNSAEAFNEVATYFNSVDSLSGEIKELSVEHAREILEKLRFAAHEDSDEEKRDVDEEKKEKNDLLEIIKALLKRLTEASQNNAAYFNDPEFAATFEKTFDALGKAIYKSRDDIIKSLIKQGKTEQAASMKANLELATPDKFKTPVPAAELVTLLQDGLTYAELLEKKVAAGLAPLPIQNVPPPPPPKKKEKDLSHKALDIISSALGGIGYKIMGVSKQDLVGAAQQINSEVRDPHLEGSGYKVASVSKEELIDPAKKANEPQQAFDPLARRR